MKNSFLPPRMSEIILFIYLFINFLIKTKLEKSGRDRSLSAFMTLLAAGAQCPQVSSPNKRVSPGTSGLLPSWTGSLPLYMTSHDDMDAGHVVTMATDLSDISCRILGRYPEAVFLWLPCPWLIAAEGGHLVYRKCLRGHQSFTFNLIYT